MSFFKSKDPAPPSAPSDSWKDKYYDLLDEQEQSEKNFRESQDLLCKTIVRFAIAVKGLNRQLDPHLNRIRDALKSNVQHQELLRSLQTFSDVLVSLESASSKPDAGLLFDFLEQLYPKLVDSLHEVQQQYEQGALSDLPKLYGVLLDLTSPAVVSMAIELPEPEEQDISIATIIDDEAVRKQLIGLLDSIEVPELLSSRAQQLKTRLLGSYATDDAIEAITALLAAVRKQQEQEQREMTEFLAKLTEQLSEMGLSAANLNSAGEEAQSRLQEFDIHLTTQLMDLQNKSALATQLQPLQALISSRLQSVNRQIQDYTRQSKAEREDNQKQLQALTQRVNDLEGESAELKNRLVAAQTRAMTDALTGLPNRFAYDERLKSELARCKRHATPMSMAVWDIDFFKQINDQYGHKSGDKALMIIARLLSKQGRDVDFVARFGGEEFVMLLPDTALDAALTVVDKLRVSIGNSSFNANGDKISITLSCGLSEYRPDDSAETLFQRADAALYQAKQNGRNQCAVSA
jgi:diguanylate cyclase